MSIDIVTFPDPSLPTNGTTGYTRQNEHLKGRIPGYDGTLLTEWDNKTTEPELKQSVYFRHGANLYTVSSADEEITGSLSAGKNYVKITGTGDTLTASWITSLSGYAYNPVTNGWYSGTDQALVEFVVLDGSDIINCKYIDRYGLERYVTQDGDFYIDQEFNIQDVNSTFLKWFNVQNLFTRASGTSLTAMTYDSGGGNIISSDSGAPGIIYIHNGISGAISSSFNSPGINPQGLAYDPVGGNLISCDSASNLIYIHSGITSTISSSFASPSTSITGLTIDTSTGNLISCDNSTGLIYIHSGITSTVSSSFSSPSTNPSGLTYDKQTGHLISLNETSGNSIVFTQKGISSTILSGFNYYNIANAKGLAYIGSSNNLLIADGGTQTIYVHGG